MTENEANQSGSAEMLRYLAEDCLRKQAAPNLLLSEDARQALHDLRVHQIELEIQNEELRRTQEELEASRARYFDLYDLAPVGYFTLSETGLILEANLNAATLLGVTRDNLIKQSLTRFIHPEDQDFFYQHCKHVFASSLQHVCELRLLKQNSTSFWVRLEAVATRTGDRLGAFRVVVIDITGLKNAEEERLELERRLQHAQKLESLGVLAGGIAHDFNNLLMAITGNMDMALLNLPRESSARPWLEQCVHATAHAAKLTRQMLAYSGKGSFIVEHLDLSKVVSENAHLFKVALAGTVTIDLRLAAQLPAIMADAGQIQQVVMNLITNASEALGEQPGVVTIATDVMECDEKYLRLSRLEEKPSAGKFVVLMVRDTGCGMDQETSRRLFDPFFTTKFSGRGLGMAAVMGIVRGHHGALLVESEPGKGTTIRVLFPLLETGMPVMPESELSVAPELTAAPPLRTGMILVVDDEHKVRNLCASMVGLFGYSTLSAADGEEAVELFREHSDEIVGVIMDLTMPRMDGLAAFTAMRLIKPEIRVLLSSGFSEEAATSRFAGQGLAGFIQKPYHLRDLRRAIELVVTAV